MSDQFFSAKQVVEIVSGVQLDRALLIRTLQCIRGEIEYDDLEEILCNITPEYYMYLKYHIDKLPFEQWLELADSYPEIKKLADGCYNIANRPPSNIKSYMILDDSEHYCLSKEYESAFLCNKKTGTVLKEIAWHYGDVDGGFIDKKERFCFTYGCGYEIYPLNKTVTSEYQILRGGDTDAWFGRVRQIGDNDIEIKYQNGKKEIVHIPEAFFMDGVDMKNTLEMFLAQFPEHSNDYNDHMKDNFGEFLPHCFYADVINNPLVKLLKDDQNREDIEKYCGFIEYMWFEGDEEVKNVVEVTILERLSDDKDIWERFGTYISDRFRENINDIVLTGNCGMWHVEKLRKESGT